MSYKTDYNRVAGLGSAKNGTHHFVVQRLTAIALIPLAVLFVFTFAGTLGRGHEAVIATYSRPWPALIALMFFVALFDHLRLGLQVVIEDYVSGERARMRWLIANALLWRGVMIAGLFAVAKIAFTAVAAA